MQADLGGIIEGLQGKTIQEELVHNFVDYAYFGSDLSDLSDEYTNVLLVTNLVHSKVIELAEEVDITAICYTNGHMPKEKDIQRAKELEIDMFSTQLPVQEARKFLQNQFGSTLEIIGPKLI